MNAGKAIYHLLSSSNDVKAELGQKIFPGSVPEKEGFPALVYAFDRQIPTIVKGRTSPMDELGCILTGYFDSYEDGQNAMEACRAALDGQSGTIAGVVIDGISFQGASDNDFEGEYQFHVFEQSYKIRMKR